MPMYFPDLKSVKGCAAVMAQYKGDKQYTGIIPKIEQELVLARQQLAEYFRTVWDDDIQAAEIEFAATEENYEQVIGLSIMKKLIGTKKLTGGK